MTGRLVGVDYGERRIGVAVSDPSGTIGFPFAQIEHRGIADAVDRLALLAQDQEAVGVVFGDPLHLSGQASPGSGVAREVASRLATRLDHPVWLWDERLSSVVAEAALREGGVRRKARRGKVDAMAAALILQSFLDAHREHPLPPGINPGAASGSPRPGAVSPGMDPETSAAD